MTMTPDQFLEYFKTRTAMAQAALVSVQAVGRWFKKGRVPDRSALLLQQAMRPKRRA
jgi:hypothetical protein